jgi:hypothetical protein
MIPLLADPEHVQFTRGLGTTQAHVGFSLHASGSVKHWSTTRVPALLAPPLGKVVRAQ